MDYVAAGFIFCAMFALGSRKRVGFLFGFIGCMIWITVGVDREIPGLVMETVVCALLNVRGWFSWGAKTNGTGPR